ncbi:hypothetical protein I4U23_014498 [Adineta vaga]|nr:hypothetical protein I4U23_014498 [Adineta vaga]
MLPLQANSAVQAGMLPTRNNGLQDQSQPQIYSLLTDTHYSPLGTKPRRKKPTQLNETIPVVINPQISRGSAGMTSTTPQSLPFFLPTQHIDDSQRYFKLFTNNSCDTNGSTTSHKQKSSFPIPLNCSSPFQSQRNSIQTNESTLITNANSVPRIMTQSAFCEYESFLGNHLNAKTLPLPSTQNNIYKHIYPQLLYVDQNLREVDRRHSLPRPLTSISVPPVVSKKTKRKYSKRMCKVASEEQSQPPQQFSSHSTVPIQPTYSNGLPSIIPSTVTLSPFPPDEQCVSKDAVMSTNFVSLTPSSSISSTKSSPMNSNNESSVVPIKQSSSSRTFTDIVEANSRLQQYFDSQEYSLIHKSTNNDSFTDHASYHLHRLLPYVHSQCGGISSTMIPTNNKPTISDAISQETITHTTSISTLTNPKRERKKRDRVSQKSMEQVSTKAQIRSVKLLSKTKSLIGKQKYRKSSIKDIRTRKELRRITDRSRLTVLKYMMQKRKQRKQDRCQL